MTSSAMRRSLAHHVSRLDPQVDALIYASADMEKPGKIWHRVRLDLAPIEIFTAT